MPLNLLIVIVCSFAISLLGLTIYLRNTTNLSNRLFGLFSLSTVAWTLSNYASDSAATYTLFYTQFAFFWGTCVVASLINFLSFFPNSKVLKDSRLLKAHRIFTVVLLPTIFTPLFISSVSVDEVGGQIHAGVLYWVFILYVVFSLIMLPKTVYAQYKHTESSTQKQQIRTLFWAVAIYATFAVTLNVVIPLVNDSWTSSQFGPASALVFVSLVAYSIARHKLFDIRLVIARSLAYVLALGIILLAYVAISTLLLRQLFDNNDDEIFTGVVNALIFLVAVVIYPYLKQFFDRVTSRFFYRDSYDPQVFLDDLNKSLVSDIELGILLRHTSKVIVDNLKSSFCVFGVHETDMNSARIIGTEEAKISKENFANLDKLMAENDRRVVIADELDDSSSLKRTLHKYDISVVIRLQVSSKEDITTIAYLMLGPKKSGNIYSKQDLRIIDIVADELVIAIQNALRFEEIQGFAITLQAKVNEATAKLKRTNEKLKELDETKDEFISMASHQLRTPLTSVKGYLSMVLEGDAGKLTVMQQELLNQAFVSSQRMVYLIADLLNVSRLKTGKFVIDSAPTNLAEVVEGEIAQLTEVAKSKKLTLKYEKPKDFPVLMLDETKIRQVIMNFADNAIYYTPANGKIELQLKEDKTNIYFMVKDNGLGVPKDEQSHLFGKFYRARNARQARPDGTGLGLFMAKKVVNAQGGDILFESKEGQGSTFGFTFKKSGLEPSSDPSETAKK